MSNILSWSDLDNNGHLFVAGYDQFIDLRQAIATKLLQTTPENFGKWQQLDVSASDAHATYELLNSTIWYQMPNTETKAVKYINPNLPWSEAHFQERVGGEPINPGVEHANWPYHAGQVSLHQNGGKYDHNYMERIWPTGLKDKFSTFPDKFWHGYRFPLGDLDDVVTQLGKDPGTRQAYLPIWFPEDTGATKGQRVPCTLGYHFIIRGETLHMQYNMRSCEIYRHFTNDVYMAVRLCQWMADQLYDRFELDIDLGQLTMNIVSMHGFVGDLEHIERFKNP
jgi:hypothetical protein